MTVPQMKEAVCRWARQCYEEKLFAGTSGNLSVYDKEAGVMAITPTSVAYEAITPEDMSVIRLDGTVPEEDIFWLLGISYDLTRAKGRKKP